MSIATSTAPAVGAPMLDVSLMSPTGAASTLHAERKGNRAVVYFLRSDSCPVCLRHARAIADLAAAGRLGPDVAVLFVVPGSAERARSLARRVTSPSVSTWASGEGHALAGLGRFLTLQHSGTFVVDGDGTVLHARTAALPTGSYSESDLLAALPSSVSS